MGIDLSDFSLDSSEERKDDESESKQDLTCYLDENLQFDWNNKQDKNDQSINSGKATCKQIVDKMLIQSDLLELGVNKKYTAGLKT